jgi:hypothetical protein
MRLPKSLYGEGPIAWVTLTGLVLIMSKALLIARFNFI